MSRKTILEMKSPKTQCSDAVKALITFFNHGKEPAQLPDFFRLTGEMVLVKSNKGDVFYVTTPTNCSCPARTYNPGKPCKHSRRYLPQPKTAQAREAEVDAVLAKERGAKRLARPTEDSIRPAGGWIGPDGKRANGPVAVF
jgi:hypothetical protein